MIILDIDSELAKQIPGCVLVENISLSAQNTLSVELSEENILQSMLKEGTLKGVREGWNFLKKLKEISKENHISSETTQSPLVTLVTQNPKTQPKVAQSSTTSVSSTPSKRTRELDDIAYRNSKSSSHTMVESLDKNHKSKPKKTNVHSKEKKLSKKVPRQDSGDNNTVKVNAIPNHSWTYEEDKNLYDVFIKKKDFKKTAARFIDKYPDFTHEAVMARLRGYRCYGPWKYKAASGAWSLFDYDQSEPFPEELEYRQRVLSYRKKDFKDKIDSFLQTESVAVSQ